MNATLNAMRIGLRRGWTEFVLSVKSWQDISSHLITATATLGWLYFNRDDTIAGTTLAHSTVMLPGLLAALIVFGMVSGPAFQLAAEREDGTLLRAKCAPRGMIGYTVGQVLLQTLNLVVLLSLVMIPSGIFFDAFSGRGLAGWFTFAWVAGLGLMATMPIGIIIGALVPNAQKAATWGFLPVMGLAIISGIFIPMQDLWGWVQVVGQAFPLYWLGLGLRSAFLPEAMAAFELGGSWRTLETVAMLSAWAAAGLVVAPKVLRRMARRQSGAAVAEARNQAAQWVR